MSTGSTALAIREDASSAIIDVVDSAEAAMSAISNLQNTLNSGFNMASLQAISRQFSVIQSSVMETNESLNIIDVQYRELGSTIEEITQRIDGNTHEQEEFNNEVSNGAEQENVLTQKIKDFTSELFSIENAKKVMDLSDELTRTTASLDSMNDGAISTQGLMDRIYASAQNTHTPYLEAGDAIAKMGNTAGSAFNSSSELLSFMDQFNKQCVIGGASAEEQSAAVESLTQAMASGTFDSGALNEILSTAPGIGSAIEQSMGWAEGSLLSYAEQGAVTAEVVKNSLLNMAGATNEKFKTMTATFAQSMTDLQSGAIGAFQPVLQKLNELASSEQFQGFVDGAIQAMNVLAGVVLRIFDLIGAVGGFIADNWILVLPVITAIVVGMVAYAAISGVLAFISGVLAIAEGIKTLATTLSSNATAAATISQLSLNAALLACPIVWIVLLIMTLIAVIFALCSKIAEATGIAETGFGVICGAVMVAVAVIWNAIVGVINGIIQFLWSRFVEPVIGIVEWVLNVMNGGFDSFGDAVANLIGNVISWFLSLGKIVTNIIDAIFGTDWTSGLSGLQDDVLSWGKNETAITLDRTAPTVLERVDYGETFDNYSQKDDDAWNNLFGGSDKQEKGGKDIEKLQNLMDTTGIPQNVANISEGTNNISEGTANINDSLGVTSEDLEYLRDIAEQDAINRFTTADIKVEMNNSNNISQDTDLDGFINGLTTRVVEALEVVREGV